MTAPAILDWLLEKENPSVRTLALRHLLGRNEQDPELVEARAAIASMPQVRAILGAQFPRGYWIKPDRGYSPRHKATIWQLIALADLGMSIGAAQSKDPVIPSGGGALDPGVDTCTARKCRWESPGREGRSPERPPRDDTLADKAVARGCEHVMCTALHAGIGLFSAHQHSTGIFPCLNGDLLRMLWYFGYGEHETVVRVSAVLARRVVDEGWICPRNGAHPRQRAAWRPCLWGCVKVLRGFAAIPLAARSYDVRQAIESGVAFLCAHDLSRDCGPELGDETTHWRHFGFPLGGESDLLEALLALVEMGVAIDQPKAVQVVVDKRLSSGAWALEHPLANAWADFGAQGAPNKWLTLRALRVLENVNPV